MTNACELLEKEKLTIGVNESCSPDNQLEDFKRLTAVLIHEINNPLTTVKGFLQLIQPDLLKLGRAEYAQIALDEIERVNKLIVDFLSKVKPMDGQKEIISINHLIDYLVKQYQSESTIKNIKITAHLTKEDIQVYVIEKKLRQVLINIIKNAIEAVEERQNNFGLIDIYLEVKELYVFIHVVDNGCGMSSDTAKYLFTPFFTTKSKGTGIGLSICKDIIEFHNGKIEYTSKENSGTKFTIKLPLYSIQEI